jgi:two-component system sensor histidine kinase UhpB
MNMLNAIWFVDQQRERNFLDAQRSRLEALEAVKRELELRAAMRRELLRHTVIAQEEERSRIARELHDETAQILAGFSLNLATLRGALPRRSPGQDTLKSLQDLSRQMSQGIYRLVNDLRPAQLDDLGLVAALQHLADLERSGLGLEVTVEVDGHRQRLDPLIETVIFRVAQEALSNVGRHARVNQAHLRLSFPPGEVRLQVSDQGIGFNPSGDLVPPQGWGLAGMRERVESVGGSFGILSEPGKGAQVEVTIPASGASEEKMDGQTHTPVTRR